MHTILKSIMLSTAVMIAAPAISEARSISVWGHEFNEPDVTAAQDFAPASRRSGFNADTSGSRVDMPRRQLNPDALFGR